MSRMIDILVDDRKFVVSKYTLNMNPDFPITQLITMNELELNDLFPLIDRINETTFRIDTNPTNFEKVVNALRWSQRDSRQKQDQDTNVINQFKTFMTSAPSVTISPPIVSSDVTSKVQPKAEIDFGQNATDSKSAPIKMDSRSFPFKPAKAGDAGIFRKANVVTKGGRIRKSDVYVDFSAANTENTLSDMNIFVKKLDKPFSNTTTDNILDVTEPNENILDEKSTQNNGFTQEFSINNVDMIDTSIHDSITQTIADDTKELNVIPKGQHVYKSRKIELNTIDDEN